MENTRSKSRKHKNYTKQKAKCTTDDVDEKESNIFSSVDKIRSGRLASAPTSPVGNIVDMQGSLDHGSVDKNEDEKSENKINNKKDENKDSNECGKAMDNQEPSEKKEDKDDKDASNKDVKSETQITETNDTSNENIDAEGKTVDAKSIEKEDTTDQKSITDETCESSTKQSVPESQGIYYLYYIVGYINYSVNSQVFIL